MSASCYLCELQFDTIPGQSTGDAVGACKLCGVLACLGHGMRDANRPAYVCGCCVPNLLAAAAVMYLQRGHKPLQTPSGDNEPFPDTPESFSHWALCISKVEDVIGDLSDDRWYWMREDIEYLLKLLDDRDAPSALRAFAGPGADQARNLIAAAVAIASKLNLPSSEMTPVLQNVSQSVKRYAS